MVQHTRKTPDAKMREINKIVSEVISNLKGINIDLGITVKSIPYFSLSSFLPTFPFFYIFIYFMYIFLLLLLLVLQLLTA